MNLESLRAHLQDQATEIDPATPVPLPTIHRRAKTIKRRRAAAVITSAAAAVAVVVAVLPGAINNSAPDPAKPPPDYTRHGITLPGAVGADRLEKAEVANPGEESLEFDWTPTSTSVAFHPYCRTTAARDQAIRVSIDDRVVLNEACDDSGPSPRHRKAVTSDDALWITTTPGKAAKVQVSVADLLTGQDATAVTGLALGIYSSPGEPKDPAVAGLPVRTPPANPGDYVKDGYRFPAKVASDTLIDAAVGDVGEQTLTLRFKISAGSGLRPFCAVNEIFAGQEFSLQVRLNGQLRTTQPCSGRRQELWQKPGGPHRFPAGIGETVEVTLQVVDSTGKPFSNAIPDLRIGVGAYTLGTERGISSNYGGAGIDEVIEYGGYTYKLAHFETAAVVSSHEVTIDTPADKPYVIGYGAGFFRQLPKATGKVKVVGLAQELSFDLWESGPDHGPGRFGKTYGQSPGTAGKVTLTFAGDKQAQGLLYLALYLPE